MEVTINKYKIKKLLSCWILLKQTMWIWLDLIINFPQTEMKINVTSHGKKYTFPLNGLKRGQSVGKALVKHWILLGSPLKVVEKALEVLENVGGVEKSS